MPEQSTEKLKNIRLAASTSFTEAEVNALTELFGALQRGGDVRTIAKSAPISSVMRKLPVMRATIERQRARRETLRTERATNDPSST